VSEATFYPGFPIWVLVHGGVGVILVIFCPVIGCASQFLTGTQIFLTRQTVGNLFSDAQAPFVPGEETPRL